MEIESSGDITGEDVGGWEAVSLRFGGAGGCRMLCAQWSMVGIVVAHFLNCGGTVLS